MHLIITHYLKLAPLKAKIYKDNKDIFPYNRMPVSITVLKECDCLAKVKFNVHSPARSLCRSQSNHKSSIKISSANAI